MASDDRYLEHQQVIPDLGDLAQGVCSDNLNTVLLCINRLCDIWVSNEAEFQEEDFLDVVSLRKLVELVGRDDCLQLQCRIVKIISHFCDGEEKAELRDQLVGHGLLQSLDRVADRLVSLGRTRRTILQSEVLENIATLLKTIICCSSVPQQLETLVSSLVNINTLLKDESLFILTQICWSLRRIAGFRNDACTQQLVDVGILDRLVEIINSSRDPAMVSGALVILSGITELRTQAVIDSGALQSLKRVLCDECLASQTVLLYDVLSTIGDYNETWMKAVADAGLVTLLINLLDNEDDKIREQTADIIGHVTMLANDAHIARLVEDGVLPKLTYIILNRPNTDNVLDAIRVLDSILDPFKDREEIFVIWESSQKSKFVNDLKAMKEDNTRTSRITALQRIVEYSGCRVLLQAVVEAGLLPMLVDLLQDDEVEIQKRAAYAIHRVASKANNAQITALVQAGVLTSLTDAVLYCPNIRIIMEAMHALDSILDGSKQRRQIIAVWESTEKRRLVVHLQGLIDEMKSDSTATVLQLIVEYSDSKVLLQTVVDSGILTYLVQLLRDGDLDMQSRAACAVRKFASEANDTHVGVLVKTGVLPVLTAVILNRPQAKTIEDAMEALHSILNAKKGREEIIATWESQEKVKLVSHLDQLAKSNKKNTRSTAVERIVEYSGCRTLLPIVVEAGLLPFLAESLRSKHAGMQKRAAYAVRRFALVANSDQIAVLVTVGVWPPLTDIVINRPHNETLTNALDALDHILAAVKDQSDIVAVWECNEKPKLVSHFGKLKLEEKIIASQQLVQYTGCRALLNAIVEADIPAFLVELLEHSQAEGGVIEDSIKAIANLLNLSKAMSEASAVWESFNKLELLDHLDKLQHHSDRWIRFCAEELIDKYREANGYEP